MLRRHAALAAVLLYAVVLANGSVETDSSSGRSLKQLFGGGGGGAALACLVLVEHTSFASMRQKHGTKQSKLQIAPRNG